MTGKRWLRKYYKLILHYLRVGIQNTDPHDIKSGTTMNENEFYGCRWRCFAPGSRSASKTGLSLSLSGLPTSINSASYLSYAYRKPPVSGPAVRTAPAPSPANRLRHLRPAANTSPSMHTAIMMTENNALIFLNDRFFTRMVICFLAPELKVC